MSPTKYLLPATSYFTLKVLHLDFRVNELAVVYGSVFFGTQL